MFFRVCTAKVEGNSEKILKKHHFHHFSSIPMHYTNPNGLKTNMFNAVVPNMRDFCPFIYFCK